jgi:type I restriction enzyme, S subunit
MKYKRYSKYKNSGVEGIGDIPEHWEISKIKFTSYVKGRIGWQGLTSEEYIEEGPYLVTGTDFKDGKINWKSCHHVEKWRYEQDPHIQIQNNDILITKDGTIGKIAFVEDVPDDTTLNTGVLVVRPLNNSILPKFQKYLFNSKLFIDFIDFIKSGTTINHLYQEEFGKFTFPVPPIDQQEIIFNFLDKQTIKFDELIAKSKTQITLLEEKRQTTINQAVTKGLDPSVPMKDSGVKWIGEIPEGWEVRKVKHSSYVKGRIGYHGLRSDEFIDEGPYLITGTDFKDGKINWNTCYHVPEWRYEQDPFIQIKNNDVLITKDGTIGKIAFIENIPGKTTLNSHLLVVRPLKNSYQPRYLYWILLADCFTYYVNLVQSGSIMNSLSQHNLENFVFPLPPIMEENKIATYLDKQTTQFDELIAKSKTQITLLEEKKQTLITSAVTGKIDVRNEATT